MTTDPHGASDGIPPRPHDSQGSDPALRWFRGPKAFDPSERASSGQPPRELRILIWHLWLSVVGIVATGGAMVLLVLITGWFPVETAWIVPVLCLVFAAPLAVLAVQLRRGSERTRAFLAGAREESAMDAFVVGGYWAYARERLRKPAVRAWFVQRERARREGGTR